MSRAVRVSDASEVAGARRIAAQCAGALRLSETAAGRAALVTTELATNILKHGGGGSILFGSDHDIEGVLTIIAFDKGNGIENVNAAMRDGFSTAGSPGTGLGAIERSAATFDLYAFPDRGTAVLCTIADEVPKRPLFEAPSRISVGGVCIPLPGEEHSGDAWTSIATRETVTIGVADGLGHGPVAATASAAAVRVFSEQTERTLDRILEDAHGVLRPTRGAAVGLARIYLAQNRLEFSGVGNIAGTIIGEDGAMRRVVSLNGIVGHEMRKVQTFSYPWTASSVLIMQSDGVSASWNAAMYPGLLQHEPALIAAVLYRDHCRGTDDATVVVAKAS
ncbi:MAG TPA: SpoIIE family protein phosphatase [Thermoanaerobaculia bacterium]|nr:SpoIIE family protein phosphatase [Thermoanaerobaculia bacterium]